MDKFCNCNRCRNLRRRKGVVLGSRRMGYFSQGLFGFGWVSDYVRHPKFQPGRRPDAEFDRKNVLKDY
jgi:hypothetical protein